LLNRIPVDVVVIDESTPRVNRRRYHDLLRQTMSNANMEWQEVATLSVVRAGISYPDSLHVFGRRGDHAGIVPGSSVDVELIKSLTFTGRAKAYISTE